MSGTNDPIVDDRGIPHRLRHRKMTDGTLTPACTCGWASSKRQHMDFERHIRRVKEEVEQ